MENEFDARITALTDGIADTVLRVAIPKIADDFLQDIPVMEDLEEIGNQDWQVGYQQALHDVKFSLESCRDALLTRLNRITKVKP